MSFFPPPSKPLPDGYPLEQIDAQGAPLSAGDLVLIPAMPEWLIHDVPPEEVSRLRAQEGTHMRILKVDAHGYVWFGAHDPWFCLRPSDVVLQHRGTNEI